MGRGKTIMIHVQVKGLGWVYVRVKREEGEFCKNSANENDCLTMCSRTEMTFLSINHPRKPHIFDQVHRPFFGIRSPHRDATQVVIILALSRRLLCIPAFGVEILICIVRGKSNISLVWRGFGACRIVERLSHLLWRYRSFLPEQI